jgi:hypothetical protein
MLITLKRNPAALLLAGLLALLLAGCGGANGGPGGGCTNLDPSRDPSLPSCGGSTSGGGTTTGTSALALTLTDAAGAATNSITPERSGTLQAKVKDSKGVALANVAVTFVTTDKTAVLTPSSGTALTDANGVAKIGLGAGTVAGAYTATASATAGSVVTGSVSYAVTFKTLSLSGLTFSPATLSAGGNASVSVTVLSDGVPYTPPLPVIFSSPCVAVGRASIGSPVLTQAGVAVASYTDKGCGVADVVTASVTLGSTTATQTGTLNVLPASAGSIKFISAQTTNIALKGTGGFGRPEFSTLTFQVFDTTGAPVSGKQIDFVFADSGTYTTVGGLTLNPKSATSAADGTVTTTVSAGTVPTSVRVVASVHDTPSITTLSNILVISTGVPDQAHFSLSTSIGNCEGRNFDQQCTVITATLGDHFGNPVPDGTAVNFTSESGIIDASCVTGSLPMPGSTPDGTTAGSQTTNSHIGPGSGTCSVNLRSGEPRKADGRVTVLAYALGEETMLDNNGNNVYDSGDSFIDKSPDIFRDDNEDGTWNTGEPCIGPNINASCSSPGDGKYNGVLRVPQTPSPQALYVSAQLVEIFSGSNASITFSPAAATCNANLTAQIGVTLKDTFGNILPAGTQISFGALFGLTVAPVLPSGFKVPNVALGIGQTVITPTYVITVGCPSTTAPGVMSVTVTTPNGVTTTGSVNIN